MHATSSDASRAVPRAMLSVYVINFLLIFPAIITLCFAMPDLDAALNDPSLYPPVWVLRHSMSTAWMTVVLMMIICLLICSNVSYLTAVTRDLFAFARQVSTPSSTIIVCRDTTTKLKLTYITRDGGFPFSKWISHVRPIPYPTASLQTNTPSLQVHPTLHIPVNAVIVTSIISFILSLIYIGSPIAFYAITSLLTVALLQCYMFSIGSILWRRIYMPDTLPPTQFSLGKFGVPVNIAAVVYCAWAFFWSFWPMVTPVTAMGFNWASVIFVGVLVFAGGWYGVKARKVYHGPVVLVRRQ
jgi:choline transport protein